MLRSFSSLIFAFLLITAMAQQSWSLDAPPAAADTPADPGRSELAMKNLQGGEITTALTTMGKNQAPRLAEALKTSSESCASAIDKARMACLESLSPNLQSAMAMLGTVSGALSGLAGAKDQCKATGNVMDDVSKLMTAYNAACGGMKGLCSSSCSSSVRAATQARTAGCRAEINATVPTPPTLNEPQITACQGASDTVKGLNTAGKAACEGFQQNLAAGVAGLAGILKNMQSSSQCKKDVASETDCTKNPTGTGCKNASTAALDCNLTANASNPRCICEMNPRAAGCSGAGSAAQTASDPSQRSTAETSSPAGGNGLGAGGLSDPPTGGHLGGGPGGGGPSPGGSGGGGMGGSLGGGAGGGTDGKAAPAAKGTGTNVLSGEYGGGGGFSGGSRSVSSDEAMGKYKAYLPGKGAGKAGALGKDEVTSGTGLTNWEKVRIRYKENKPTLLNN